MKKTISTILALFSALAASGADYTISPNESYFTTDDLNLSGWTGRLAAAYLQVSPEGATLPEQLVLNSITLTHPESDKADVTVKLAIATIDGENFELKGLTEDATTISPGSETSFTFDSLTLDTDALYYFFFMKETTTLESFEGISTVTELGNAKLRTSGVIVGALLINDEDDWMIGRDEGVISSGTTTTPWRVVTASYHLSDAAVPEPTTATLSLLALAGLAARRRRK